MPRYLCTDMEGAPSDDESGWSWMEIFAEGVRSAATEFCERTGGLGGLMIERGRGRVLIQSPCGERAEVEVKALQSVTYYCQSIRPVRPAVVSGDT